MFWKSSTNPARTVAQACTGVSALDAWWTVAGVTTIGAFIDFYIGKAGQRRVSDWLETWWLRLSYLRWGNFGREEARFAVQVIDRVFGRRIF